MSAVDATIVAVAALVSDHSLAERIVAVVRALDGTSVGREPTDLEPVSAKLVTTFPKTRELSDRLASGEALRILRVRHGETQEQLAKIVGASPTRIYDMESQGFDDSAYLVRIASHYGVTPKQIIDAEVMKDAAPIRINRSIDQRMKAARFLRYLRQRVGENQAMLAQAVGASKNLISKMETHGFDRSEYLMAIAKHYGVQPDEILAGGLSSTAELPPVKQPATQAQVDAADPKELRGFGVMPVSPYGRKLREARHKLGLTQYEVANKLDVQQSEISKAEHHPKDDPDLVRRMCLLYGVNPLRPEFPA